MSKSFERQSPCACWRIGFGKLLAHLKLAGRNQNQRHTNRIRRVDRADSSASPKRPDVRPLAAAERCDCQLGWRAKLLCGSAAGETSNCGGGNCGERIPTMKRRRVDRAGVGAIVAGEASRRVSDRSTSADTRKAIVRRSGDHLPPQAHRRRRESAGARSLATISLSARQSVRRSASDPLCSARPVNRKYSTQPRA